VGIGSNIDSKARTIAAGTEGGGLRSRETGRPVSGRRGSCTLDARESPPEDRFLFFNGDAFCRDVVLWTRDVGAVVNLRSMIREDRDSSARLKRERRSQHKAELFTQQALYRITFQRKKITTEQDEGGFIIYSKFFVVGGLRMAGCKPFIKSHY
jgi:hypothetical protein